MRALVAATVLLLTTGSPAYAQEQRAAEPCSGQIHPNPGFERGTTGWTAGPRIVVLGDAHNGRAYASLAGLDVTHTDSLRTTVTVPANCNLTVKFWVRTTATDTSVTDSMNVSFVVTGVPPKTYFALRSDGSPDWYQYSGSTGTAATERSATVIFYASETAGNGVAAFDVDDVRFTLS
ncbi:hypothetical protein OWR29_13840 [Actinoplanes sp. Pm04-4]|uniref:Uncharacterized protein n=1 Tax=Paractinoplanes pyxinae TaxID=2997416 RepID=A0ABT4AXV6_9ACTN|nr:hypothetical protein [Actinoplanes pyxinae]MCY1139074.1 hypothetical protein [Actinoplanes pyxinae]